MTSKEKGKNYMDTNENKIFFTVIGEPIGKGRPKFTRQGNYVRTYTPEKTASYENLVKLEYEIQVLNNKKSPFSFNEDTPLSLEIKAYFKIPKSTSKKRKTLMEEGKIRPIKKPDIDNVFKVIADSLNGIAYKDDSQIISGSVSKFYSEQPRVEVTIKEMTNRES